MHDWIEQRKKNCKDLEMVASGFQFCYPRTAGPFCWMGLEILGVQDESA